MPTTAPPMPAEEILSRWLTDTSVPGWDNPAGDLFSSEYAVQEITMTTQVGTRCSMCTGSQRVLCC